MKKKVKITALLLLVAIIVIPYVAAGWNERPVDDEFRALAPGQFVQLTDGQIHYRWLGDESDEVIVLLHGISIPSFVFAQYASALVESGYRVLIFDHFGHGFSDRPSSGYDDVFFRRQMTELFDKLEFTKPVHVVGYSMGGVIAIDFAAHSRERVKSLTLIAPAGIRLVNSVDSPLVKVLKAPVIGHWLWRIVARRFYSRNDGVTVADDDASSKERLQGNPALQADYEGYFAAMRQIFRFLPLSGREDLLQKVNATQLPITAIFGNTDDTVDVDSAEILQQLIPRTKLHLVDGGTHHLIIHRWQEIHEHTIAALNSDQAAGSR